MPESGTYGSVRGALSNERPYRDKKERPPPGPIFVTGDRWFVAELNRFKGQLLLRQGHSEAADELYRKALSIAREQR